MDSNDLFSFLADKPADDETDSEEEYEVDEPNVEDALAVAGDTSLKRKAEEDGAEALTKNEETKQEDGDIESIEPATKKLRVASPAPVVVDEFETEAKREVAASAGLTGAVEAGSRLELRHQVRHQVAVPPGYNYIPIANHVPPAKPAREYKFTLDPFQQVSVHAIQRNESVLVSAHTSAGKTVVAEYAIAQCLENKQRVIYTSPIKVCNEIFFCGLWVLSSPVGLE